MNFLVIGKGGREHAICKALANSESVNKVFALPGNQGMQPETELLSAQINAEEISRLVDEQQIDVVVIGPEDPLVAGLATELRQRNVKVFGPGKPAAQLEGSKIFSKQFMRDCDIPTAHFAEVDSVEKLKSFLPEFTPPYVLKADGLAAGKGVYICKDQESVLAAATGLFEDKVLGEAGRQALIEQFQPGYELSYFVLTNGKDYVTLPLAQDHKKLLNDDEGPNTGGMGTVAPMRISQSLNQEIIEKVVEPTVTGLSKNNFDYCGVVFIGLMITQDGPQVLEYNVRFGDPETQVLMPLLDGDWGKVFASIAQGDIPEVAWKNTYSACVVLAAENYPTSPMKGVEIAGEWDDFDDRYFLHAGTVSKDGHWYTNGGRVLNAIGKADNLEEAISKAYQQASKVNWPGMQMRSDIGAKSSTN